MRGHKIAAFTAGVLLLIAMADMPYGYYTLVRWVACAAAAFIAYIAAAPRLRGIRWLFVVLALIFNPIVPLHLGRDVWQIVDCVTAAWFLAILIMPIKASSTISAAGQVDHQGPQIHDS